MLRLWNTLTHQPEDFQPIKRDQVGLYTCGPTVYNPVTLGNWRAFLFDDVLARTLRQLKYRLTWVMNVTDVGHLAGDVDEGEDKVAHEAAKRGVSAWDLARGLEQDFLQGMERLHIQKPDVLPRATDHIVEQIDLVKKLEENGFTYCIRDGIYFDTSKFSAYGKLSGQKLEDKKAGARVDVNPEKKNPTDFALWKFSPSDKKREMEWNSPWGVGFPGWHIECSAMARKYLGQPFDIHCGGVDHIPVHHENEIAQSEAAFEQPLANYWLHNEFLLVDGRRMGKSEGNAYALDDIIAKGFDPLAYRYFCLGTHYRQKLNFTWEALKGAQNSLKKIQGVVIQLGEETGEVNKTSMESFETALEDDLNTPQALAAVWELTHQPISDQDKLATLLKMDEVLGFGLKELIGRPKEKVEISAEVQRLAEERSLARGEKDWERADQLRKQIESLGWRIEDKNRGDFDLIADQNSL